MSICRIDGRFLCDWACERGHCHLKQTIAAHWRKELDTRPKNELPPNPKQAYGDLKVPLALVPSTAIILMGQAFKEGARKYGPFNWREKSVEGMTYAHASLRHLMAWIDGEEIDPESGNPHLAHVLACVAIMVDAAATGCLLDNRPPKGVAGELLRAKTVAPSAVVSPAEPDGA